jgi:Flp pilus assembly protein TadB
MCIGFVVGSDIVLYCIAMITLIGSVLYKQHERRQRQQQQQQHVHMNQQHNQARLHHIHPRQRHRPIFELRRNHRHLYQA